MANSVSQFAREGKTGEIYTEAFNESMRLWRIEEHSAASSGHTHVCWCIEDTFENQELDFDPMYADYLARVIERMQSYQGYVEGVIEHAGNDVPRLMEEAYDALVAPYLAQLAVLKEQADDWVIEAKKERIYEEEQATGEGETSDESD